MTTVGTFRPPRLPVAFCGRHSVPSMRSPSRALTTIRSAVGTRAGVSAARRTAGMELVTWRGLASSGATPGTGSSQRSGGDVTRSPMAAIQAPSASQPTDFQTPSHGLIRLPAAAAETVRGVFGGRPRPRFGAGAASSSPTSRSWRASWISTWTKRLPSGDGSGAAPTPPLGSPCSRSPAVSTIRSWPSAVSRTTWNQPSASDTNSSDPSGSQRVPTSTDPSPATTRLSPVATSTIAICELSETSGPRWAMTAIRRPSGAHS